MPVLIALDGLVLAESFQEIGEGLLGNIFRNDRLAQRHEDWMRRLAFVTGVQFVLPPMEQFECAVGIGNFVAKIIGPAAVGVDIVKMLVQRFGEQPRYNIEIFVVMRGQPARVFLRFFRRAAGLGRMPGDVEFAGMQHQKRWSPCKSLCDKSVVSGPPRKTDPTKSNLEIKRDSSLRSK